MKTTTKYVDKIYKLTRDTAPLSLILRYARNQNSPFQDDQDNNAILEPIVFENGFLTVPKNNQVLQKFLDFHPGKDRVYVEVDKAKEASVVVQELNDEVDALIEARQLSVDQVENVSRVIFQNDITTVSTAELRRDILVFAKNQPKDFLLLLKDPALKLNAKIQLFFDKNLLQLRNSNKEVWYNTPSNKKKMLNVPYGEDPIYIVASFFQSDEGIESLKHLSGLAKNV